MPFESRSPDYNLKISTKAGKKRTTLAGVGWQNDKGHITIQLNPCIVLAYDENLYITLFPIDHKEAASEQSEKPGTGNDGGRSKAPAQGHGAEDLDDDIPF